MNYQVKAVSTWAPLRNGVFRALWIAVLVSNVGTWMQLVGAQWLLVDLPHAAVLVALVQTADYLPDVLFALVGGVLADIFDRRRVLLVVQLTLSAVGLMLTVLTFLGQMPAALLLVFTFVIGCSSAFANPAYQSLVPDIVPRSELRAASALSSISINLARLAGPALAGIVIARIGVAAVFGLNALAFLFFGIVVALWRPKGTAASELPERFVSAVRAAGGYVRHAPVVRRILLRAALFLVPASALWALLPLIASRRLHLGADGYGLLLGALGAGAIAGAVLLPRIRSRASDNAMLTAASLTYAAVLVLLFFAPTYLGAVLVLLPAGLAWITVLSNVNAELQLFLPAWVRARGLAVYQMVLFGAQAAGALLWGLLAEALGVEAAFLIAAGALAGAAATIRWWPLIDTSAMDRGVVEHWAEPHLVFEPTAEGGPVVVKTVYTVAADREPAFLAAMERVRLSRLRTGATQWGLFRDGDNPSSFVELFVVPTWEEHLRQHRYRQTGTDRHYEQQADALSDPPPEVSHLVAVGGPQESPGQSAQGED
jgi:MFS family permease